MPLREAQHHLLCPPQHPSSETTAGRPHGCRATAPQAQHTPRGLAVSAGQQAGDTCWGLMGAEPPQQSLHWPCCWHHGPGCPWLSGCWRTWPARARFSRSPTAIPSACSLPSLCWGSALPRLGAGPCTGWTPGLAWGMSPSSLPSQHGAHCGSVSERKQPAGAQSETGRGLWSLEGARDTSIPEQPSDTADSHLPAALTACLTLSTWLANGTAHASRLGPQGRTEARRL